MVPFPIIFLYWANITLSTAAFYGCTLVFAVLGLRSLSRRRWSRAALFAAISCVPPAWYVSAQIAATRHHARLDAQVIEARQWPKLAHVPRTLVLDGGGRSEWQDRLVEMGAFDEIFLNWPGQKTRIANARAKCDGGARGTVSIDNFYRSRAAYLVCAVQTKVDAVPSDGLHLYMTPRREVDQNWIRYFDLWVVEGEQRRLIAFDGLPMVRRPAFPPVLSTGGFQMTSEIGPSPMPWYGEIQFLFERLGLDADQLTPQAQPSPDEVRAEFLRLRDSSQRADQRIAGFIAKAVGASVLSADDVLPSMKSDAIDYDFGRLVGSRQFCESNNRLCDFAEQMAVVCKSKSRPNAISRYQKATGLCDRIPEQCNRCRTALLCQPHLTGKVTGCSKEDDAASVATMSPLRQF